MITDLTYIHDLSCPRHQGLGHSLQISCQLEQYMYNVHNVLLLHTIYSTLWDMPKPMFSVQNMYVF